MGTKACGGWIGVLLAALLSTTGFSCRGEGGGGGPPSPDPSDAGLDGDDLGPADAATAPDAGAADDIAAPSPSADSSAGPPPDAAPRADSGAPEPDGGTPECVPGRRLPLVVTGDGDLPRAVDRAVVYVDGILVVDEDHPGNALYDRSGLALPLDLVQLAAGGEVVLAEIPVTLCGAVEVSLFFQRTGELRARDCEPLRIVEAATLSFRVRSIGATGAGRGRVEIELSLPESLPDCRDDDFRQGCPPHLHLSFVPTGRIRQ